MTRMPLWGAFIAVLLIAAGCSGESPPPQRSEATTQVPATPAPATPTLPAAAPTPAGGPSALYAGMHYRDNVLEFNPTDLPEGWQQSFLPGLAAGATIWVSISNDVVEAQVERVKLTREADDPEYRSMGTLKVHVRPIDSLREEIVFVSLSPLARPTWTTRVATADEEAFGKARAKEQFRAITGAAYTGPVTYADQRGSLQTIDLDRLGFAAFVVETRRGTFLITAFQLPGESVGHTAAFRSENGDPWQQVWSFTDDFRARIPRIDVDGDGVPELLHSGPTGQAWDLEAFYPEVKPILRISP